MPAPADRAPSSATISRPDLNTNPKSTDHCDSDTNNAGGNFPSALTAPHLAIFRQACRARLGSTDLRKHCVGRGFQPKQFNGPTIRHCYSLKFTATSKCAVFNVMKFVLRWSKGEECQRREKARGLGRCLDVGWNRRGHKVSRFVSGGAVVTRMGKRLHGRLCKAYSQPRPDHDRRPQGHT
jgi:hypothetical protein